MSDDHWYRRSTWTAEDQAAFFAKLKRSRGGFHKAQYCRIQAHYLQKAGYYEAALELLNKVMTEWPTDAQHAVVYHQMAQCHEKLGDRSAALIAYRMVFDAQRRQPGELTGAHLGFGLLVATAPYPDLYGEALSILNEFGASPTFPIEEFELAAARSLIAKAQGDDATASRQARTALAAAAKTHSGLSRHPTLGLVSKIDPILEDRLKRIAVTA